MKYLKVDAYDGMCFFGGLVFFAPVALLVRTQAWISEGQFFLLQLLLSAVIALGELPTGYLTDRIGYHCLSRSRISKNACAGVAIREDTLLNMLADMLQEALNTALGDYRLSLAELPRQAADRAALREKITNRKQEIQRLRGIVRSLYENLVQGVLTKDEYFDYKEKYESRIADLSVEMEQLEDGLRTMDTQLEQHRALKQDAAQIKTDRALTGALIERLIDRIEVSHDKQITVRYRFQSEFETYAEVLEQCRNM